MARKMSPHEERAFVKASPFVELRFRRDGGHVWPCRPKAGELPIDQNTPEVPDEFLNWDECSWPDEWGW